jgi:hypothetical protein
MGADGNLISKGQGEGAAIMLQPFLPDQTSFNQMNQVLANKQQQKAAQAQRQQIDEADKRDSWLKRLAGSGKYHQNDEGGIFNLQKDLINEVENYKSGTPTSAIEQKLIALEYIINNSKQSLDEDNRIQHDRLVNGDKVWYNGINAWEKANVLNEGKTPEEIIKGIARRTAAQKQVIQGGEKITNPHGYIDGIIGKAQMGDAKQVTYKDKYGTQVTETVRQTDKGQLEKTLDFEIENNPEVLRVFGSPQEFKNQAYARIKNEERFNFKGAQSNNGKATGWTSSGDSVTNNLLTLTPVNQLNLIDPSATKKSHQKYINSKRNAANITRNESGDLSEKGKEYAKESEISYEDFAKKYGIKLSGDYVVISSKGNSSNSKRQDAIDEEGKIIKNALPYAINNSTGKLVVTTEVVKDGNTTEEIKEVSIDKNPQFFNDNGVTNTDEMLDAVRANKDRILTMGKDGKVVKNETVRGNQVKMSASGVSQSVDKSTPKVGSKYKGKVVKRTGKQGNKIVILFEDNTQIIE